MHELEILLKVNGLLIGIVGTLLLCGGGLIAYIFRQHVEDNKDQFSKNYDEHKQFDERLRDKK